MKKVQSADGTTIAFDQLGKGPAAHPGGWYVRTTSDGLRDRATRSTTGAALHRVSL